MRAGSERGCKGVAEADGEEDRYIVPALQRGLDVLALLSRAGKPIAVPEACKALDISRATAFRLFHTLEANGFIVRLPSSNSYRLHSKVMSLGFDYLFSLDVAEIARPHLDALRNALGATTHLGIRVGTDMYYVMRSAMPEQQGFSSQAGKKHPAHAVSSGRALLFDLEEGELDLLYRNYNFANFPSFVPQDLRALKTQLAVERAQGFVITQSLSYESIRHIAVPVRDASGAATAAVNVSDRYYSDDELTGLVLPQLSRTTDTISHALGYRHSARAV